MTVRLEKDKKTKRIRGRTGKKSEEEGCGRRIHDYFGEGFTEAN